MKIRTSLAVLFLVFFFSCIEVWADSSTSLPSSDNAKAAVETVKESEKMLTSLLELRGNLEEQIQQSKTKLSNSNSAAEKVSLEEEINRLDQQLSENTNDFERIATGVEQALFAEKKPETFSWKDELSSLVEPVIKELKRFTIRARQKSDLKDQIVELQVLETAAIQAVANLQTLLEGATDNRVQQEINALLPEWINIEKRLSNKLDLAQTELKRLEDQEVSFIESTSSFFQAFFKNRGLYLILSVFVFFFVLLGCKLLYQSIIKFSSRLFAPKKQQSFNHRLFYIIYQVSSFVFAILGLFFVLYVAEDWFLMSLAIIFFLGFFWTIRQVLPRLWQQGRLMLNLGAVREGERLVMYGVPWKVADLNVFCRLSNPSLNQELRLPVEKLIGLVSRPYKQDEPWFPCIKGDWVVVGTAPRARVVSLSHETVEVVERGGRRVSYPTETFLQACPANLSRNFRIRVPFGLSYGLQENVTTTIPAIIKDYIESKMVEHGYDGSCLSLQVEFLQANSSSLDLMVLADFEGRMAEIYKRLERFIQRCCVDCCTANNWEIPFPQLTVHRPTKESN